MGLFNRCQGKAIVIIIVLWKLSLEDLKMRCFMDMKKITAHLMNFQKQLENISNTTTTRIQAKTKWMPPVKYRETSM